MSGHMGIFGFGEDSPLPTASTVSSENPPDELNYSAAEFRLIDDVPYDTRTGYIEQFPEQEDLSIFGWTNYPDPAVGFGADAVTPVAVPRAQVAPATVAKRLAAFAGVGLVGAGIAYALASKAQPGTRKLVAAGGGAAAIGAVWWIVGHMGYAG